ncbi:TolB family protein [Bacillus massilinigeriensis]|uniref:TolB family protein n=1 Tax=Bacillus massilionigeriensis TaxID=1805475 RepID=UPI00096AD9D7|nr:hypothetical protein [Bacillus massilionigeriensis]
MRIFVLFILFLSIFLPVVATASPLGNVRAAFIRDGDLWVIHNNKEKKITNTGTIFSKPKWSYDGKWLLYQNLANSEIQPNEKQSEVWVYQVDTGERKKIMYDGTSPSWSPRENIIAFNTQGILNLSDLSKFYNIATGVSGFTWLPNGNGFLLSSAGVLRPDGWTSSILFKKQIQKPYEDVILFGGVERFFTLPKEIGLNNNKIPAIYADQFHYSPSQKWISFIVSPTASLSMDSNMLCVISSDGKDFEVMDEVIFEVGEPKWAPSNDTLAFIAGAGRIVFGFKNKELKLKEMPVSSTYTPKNYADLDFDWITNESIVTSRIKEKEWSNDFKEHPLPILYSINLETKKQTQITKPPKGYGDYNPQYIKSIGKLVWLRGTSLTDQKRNLWVSNPDGEGEKEWIKNVDAIEFYLGEG